MRRLATSLFIVAVVLAGCGTKPAAVKPPAPLAVFELTHSAGVNPPVSTQVSLLIVDTASGSAVETIPLGGVTAVSDVVTATGVPKLVVASSDGFRELDFDTHEMTLLATRTAGLERTGVGHTGDGNPVLWQVSRDGALIEVLEVAGATVRRASADLRAPAAGAPQEVEGRIGGRLMLLAADDAQAVFVDAIPTRADATHFVRAVYRADFHAESVVQLAPAKEWPGTLLPLPDVRVEEAVRKWGVPSIDRRGAGFFGLDGARRAAIETVPLTGVHPDVVFQPGGETYLAVERMRSGGMGARGDAPVRLIERSMYGAEPRTLLASASGPLVPVGVAGDLVAFSRRTGSVYDGTFELRLRRIGDATESVVVSRPLGPAEWMSAVYLGSYEPQRRP